MKKLFKYVLKEHWKIILLIIGLIYVQVYSDVTVLVLLSFIFKAVSLQKTALLQNFLKETLLYIILSLISSLLLSCCYIHLSSSFPYNLRNKAFDIISDSDNIEDYDKILDSLVIARIMNIINSVQVFVLFSLKKIVFIIVFVIFLINEVIQYNVDLITILIASGVILTVFMLFNLKRNTKDYVSVRAMQVYLTTQVYEKIKRSRIIRYFSTEQYEINKFAESVNESRNLNIQSSKKIWFSLVATTIVNITFCVLVYTSIIFFKRGLFEVFYVLLIVQVMVSLMSHSDVIFALSQNFSPTYLKNKKLNELMSLEKDDSHYDDNIIDDSFDNIEFNDVSFKIGEKEILKNISFKIENNASTLIIGPVGSGKTSIAHLLTKFNESTSGSILINGIDIDNISGRLLREKIRFVPTESFIFKDTLLENIRLGNKSISKEDVMRVCEKTLLSEYDLELDKQLYENDSRFSNDFKQKLALTRALLQEADVYIFDNCFSHIDLKSKKIILENIKENTCKKTVIFLDNFYDQLYDVDNIIVLKNCEIADQGKYDEIKDKYDFSNKLYVIGSGEDNGI